MQCWYVCLHDLTLIVCKLVPVPDILYVFGSVGRRDMLLCRLCFRSFAGMLSRSIRLLGEKCVMCWVASGCSSQDKIIIKMYLIENKEVTLLAKLNR